MFVQDNLIKLVLLLHKKKIKQEKIIKIIMLITPKK